MNFARTFGDQCCGSGLQAYNPPMVPVASFSVPLNMHAPYGVLPAYRYVHSTFLSEFFHSSCYHLMYSHLMQWLHGLW